MLSLNQNNENEYAKPFTKESKVMTLQADGAEVDYDSPNVKEGFGFF